MNTHNIGKVPSNLLIRGNLFLLMHVMSRGQSGPFNCVTFNVLNLYDTLDFVISLIGGPENIAAERERYQEDYPADKMLCEERCGNSVHAKGYGGTGRLNTLVVTSHTSKPEGVVGDTGHGIVGKALESSVTDIICQLSVTTFHQKVILNVQLISKIIGPIAAPSLQSQTTCSLWRVNLTWKTNPPTQITMFRTITVKQPTMERFLLESGTRSRTTPIRIAPTMAPSPVRRETSARVRPLKR